MKAENPMSYGGAGYVTLESEFLGFHSKLLSHLMFIFGGPPSFLGFGKKVKNHLHPLLPFDPIKLPPEQHHNSPLLFPLTSPPSIHGSGADRRVESGVAPIVDHVGSLGRLLLIRSPPYWL